MKYLPDSNWAPILWMYFPTNSRLKGLKTNIKRPWIHYIIIIAYITAPLANILLLVLMAKLPLATIVHRLFKGYGLLAGLWLLTAPLVGIGLYFIHRISWYIFSGTAVSS